MAETSPLCLREWRPHCCRIPRRKSIPFGVVRIEALRVGLADQITEATMPDQIGFSLSGRLGRLFRELWVCRIGSGVPHSLAGRVES